MFCIFRSISLLSFSLSLSLSLSIPSIISFFLSFSFGCFPKCFAQHQCTKTQTLSLSVSVSISLSLFSSPVLPLSTFSFLYTNSYSNGVYLRAYTLWKGRYLHRYMWVWVEARVQNLPPPLFYLHQDGLGSPNYQNANFKLFRVWSCGANCWFQQTSCTIFNVFEQQTVVFSFSFFCWLAHLKSFYYPTSHK